MEQKTFQEITRRIGQKIRAERKKAGLTQEELAERADVHYTFIGAAERGETNLTIKTLIRVAEALETPIEFFLKSAESESKPRITEKDAELAQLVKLLRKHDARRIRKIRRIASLVLEEEKR